MKTTRNMSLSIFLCSMLGAIPSAYAASASEDEVGYVTNVEEGKVYVNAGINYYNMKLPEFTLPYNTGSTGGYTVQGTQSSVNMDHQMDAVQPSIALGYQFYNDDELLRHIFGERGSVEVRYSYSHDSNSDVDNYSSVYGNAWFIAGNDYSVNDGDSYKLNYTDYSYDDTLHTLGLYYTGNKPFGNRGINSPYVGLDLLYLEQNMDYITSMSSGPYFNDELLQDGSDDISTYYYGATLGDKLTLGVGRSFDVFGDLGLSLLAVHAELDANQIPISNMTPGYSTTSNYNVKATDDTVTYRMKAELGTSYYFVDNEDTESARLTFSVGMEYWNDVPYASNPTSGGEEVTLDYDSSTSYYAGLQLHVPFS